MANNVTAFFEVLLAASGDYNAAKVGQLSFLKGVYLDVKPEIAHAGRTIQVYFPDVGPFTDQAANDWTPEDINPGFVDVVFDQRPGKALLIRDWDQFLSGTTIIDKYIDPLYKRGQEYLNGRIASQITPANFNAYPPIAGTTPGEVTVANAASAWDLLAGNKVPVDNPEDLSIFTNNTVHKNMMTDTQWYQENLVGAVIAQRARESGSLGTAFNFTKRWDQQAPKVNAAVTGTSVGVTNGSGAVTGSGTAFTTQLAIGQYLVFSNDPTATPYRITAITSDTALTVTPNYAGTTGAAIQATAQSNTCVALHKYAIALAVRPLELVNSGEYIQSRLVMLGGIPFRIMASYQHLKAGWLLSADVGCAVKVIRPDFGAIITC